MTDKKFTDREIIKALEYCLADKIECDKCVLQRECESNPFYSTIAKYAFDLIKRQKAEIKRLKKEVSVARDAYISIQDRYKHTKAEAYEEFAERLNEKAQIADCFDSYNMVVGTHFIDNLLKEMVSDIE